MRLLAMGYSHIFCIIDMDTKDKEPELKDLNQCVEYRKTIGNARQR